MKKTLYLTGGEIMANVFRLEWISCVPMEERAHLGAPGTSGTIEVLSYVMAWVCRGKGTTTIDGKRYTAEKGDIFMLLPNQIVRGDTDPLEPLLSYSFAFAPSSFPDSWPPRKNWPAKRTMPADDIITPLFEYIQANCPVGEGQQPSELKRNLELAVEMMISVFLFGPVGRPQALARAYPSSVQRVIDWMYEFTNSHIERKVTLEDLAAVSGISSKHLCRLFRKHLGYAPLEALNLYRLTRSLIGLTMGTKIETVASQYGFSDASHYTRRFKAYFNMSPSAMRKAMSLGYKPKLPPLPHMLG